MRARSPRTGEEDAPSDFRTIEAPLKRAFEIGQAHLVPVEVVSYTREVMAATAAKPQAMTVAFL
ncbi:MAG TPA: hypothetical protein VGD55_04050, partial [Acidothermaceae bacterium]